MTHLLRAPNLVYVTGAYWFLLFFTFIFLNICLLSFNKNLGILSSLFICGVFIIVYGIKKRSENMFNFIKIILHQSNAILKLSGIFKSITEEPYKCRTDYMRKTCMKFRTNHK